MGAPCVSRDVRGGLVSLSHCPHLAFRGSTANRPSSLKGVLRIFSSDVATRSTKSLSLWVLIAALDCLSEEKKTGGSGQSVVLRATALPVDVATCMSYGMLADAGVEVRSLQTQMRGVMKTRVSSRRALLILLLADHACTPHFFASPPVFTLPAVRLHMAHQICILSRSLARPLVPAASKTPAAGTFPVDEARAASVFAALTYFLADPPASHRAYR